MERLQKIDLGQRDPEQVSKARQIGIATATMYPGWQPLQEGLRRSTEDSSGLRGDLAIKMLTSATEKGFQVRVVDGGSSDEFKRVLQDTLGIIVSKEQQRGMSPGRRQAFEEVSAMEGIKVVAWTEPEKISMVDNLLVSARPILDGEADVVVPKRDAAAFATYPDYQAEWEQRANKEFNERLKKHGLLPKDADDLDAWIGPRIIKNDLEVLKLFTHQWEIDQNDPKFDRGRMDPELWPNAIFLPIVGMLWRDKMLGQNPRVVSVPINYRHPSEQTAIEQDSPVFAAKREQQFNNIIGATDALLQVLEHDAQGNQLYIQSTD